jgi:hypothetical protein
MALFPFCGLTAVQFTVYYTDLRFSCPAGVRLSEQKKMGRDLFVFRQDGITFHRGTGSEASRAEARGQRLHLNFRQTHSARG